MPYDDAPPTALRVPSPRTHEDLAAVEQRAAGLADLVLKLTALADRYARQLPSPADAVGHAAALARVDRLRTTAASGRSALQQLAGR